MITDEQVIKALDAYYGIEHVCGARESLIEGMRKALEAYEKSKWVKFDVDDDCDKRMINAAFLSSLKNEQILTQN